MICTKCLIVKIINTLLFCWLLSFLYASLVASFVLFISRMVRGTPKKAKRKLSYPKERPSAKRSRLSKRMRSTKAGIWIVRKLVGKKNFNHDMTAVQTDTSKGFSFKLSDCSGTSDIVNMYDQYCIKSVGYRFVIRVATPTQAASLSYPGLTIIHRTDLDDDTAPTSVDNIMECENTVVDILLPGQNVTTRWYNFSPRVAAAVFTAGSAFSGYAIGKKATWINNTSTGVDHYGLKCFIPQSPLGWKFEIDLELRYTIGLKNVI